MLSDSSGGSSARKYLFMTHFLFWFGCFPSGKWQDAARHLERSIEIVEMHHGPSSVEMGHELFKLAQILFNG